MSEKERKKSTYPSFDMLSKGYYSKFYRRNTMDAIEILENMNPKSDEMKAWKHLRIKRNPRDNLAIVTLSMADKKNYFYKGAKRLIELEMIRKVSNGLYMINPFFYVPIDMDEETTSTWDGLNGKEG